jgi:class 3 adenylate cyclase
MATPIMRETKVRRRISTLLFAVLTGIACLVLIGLIVLGLRLFEIRAELGELRDSALPRLVKLTQLSQEASATSSIAPALSSNPTRSEFQTLLSRIDDKKIAQRRLIGELAELFEVKEAAQALRRNGDLLLANLGALTHVVRQQIIVSEKLEKHAGSLRGLLAPLSRSRDKGDAPGSGEQVPENRHATEIGDKATRVILTILNTLLDPNKARFSRNQDDVEAQMRELAEVLKIYKRPTPDPADERVSTAVRLVGSWSSRREVVFADKAEALRNAFRIKALAEENSLIANRLLSSASNAFWRASNALETQVRLVNETTRFTLAAIVVVVLAFSAGNFFVWYVLKRRVFRRLDLMGDALRTYADSRDRPLPDSVPDEIGVISGSLMHYMAVIDAREAELAAKSAALEQLSNQLAKYLSPQVYDSIFSGRQEVKVSSSRKKLTIFFSDIVGFTETADRLESEELTRLLNQYLTEMSGIALEYGATIDKYVGDAILIFFGDPETRGEKEDALACVEMAIAMRKRMHELADVWRESGIEKPLKVRMGIHTGYCTVGNFGSEDRMDYTIVGGAVNVASRLEEQAPPGDILISYETFAHVNSEICCQECDVIDVKGIAYPIATYSVIDAYANLDRARRRFRQDHPNLKVDLDIDAMTAHERSKAMTVLRDAMDILSSGGGHSPPGPKRKSRPDR